jgi:hypothetical protein
VASKIEEIAQRVAQPEGLEVVEVEGGHRRFMGCLLFMLFAAAAIAQDVPDATGWSTARWGMTLEQAKGAVSGSRDPVRIEKDYGLLTRLEASPVQLGPYPATARLEFQPDRDYLSAVSVKIADDIPRASAYETLRQALVEKYGKPTSEDSTNDRNSFGSRSATKTVQWRLKSSMIVLTWSDYGDIGYVSVRYSERKADTSL